MYSLVLRVFSLCFFEASGKYPVTKDDWSKNMTEDAINRMVNKGVYGAEDMKLQTAVKLEDAARKLRSADITTHGEDIKKIIEPFYRGNNAISYPGTGIGLSLVNQIIKNHNGTINITSKVGRGTKITLLLPSA